MDFHAHYCERFRHRPRSVRPLVAAIATLMLAPAAPASASTSGAFAWGDNFRGQLGDGESGFGTSRTVPVPVSGLSEVTAVAGGEDHSIALLRDGTVMAWGENSFGELGDGGSGGISVVPVAVKGLSEVTAIAAGGNHALALKRDGTVMAWGYNGFGQLGDGESGSETNRNIPVAVTGLREVIAIAAGRNDSLALLRNGTVMSWGENAFGDLGKGAIPENTNPTPTPVAGLSEVTAIAAGLGDVGTALLKNGTLMDWGYGKSGELGNGTTESSDVPVAVSGLSAVAGLPTGGESMALLRNGTVVDWGLNAFGELGDGTTAGPEECPGFIPCSKVPVTVNGLSGATAIAAGLEHRLALLSNGTVVSWGNGALGNGFETDSDVAVPAKGLSGVTAIGAGQYFSLAATGIAPVPTLTSVSCSPQIVVAGQPATCSATVTDTAASGATAPTGMVAFTTSGEGSIEGTCQLKSATTVSSNCSVNYKPGTTPKEPERSDTITATFEGDEGHEGSKGTTSATVFSPTALARGAFVIGNSNATVGKAVTFYEANEWSRLNSLSGGSAPASFKGFAESSASPPTCGEKWTSKPGTSSASPATVPEYIEVVVASEISKSGSTISGNAPEVVVVKTNPGYSPANQGTGKVVAVVCSS